MEYIQSFLSSRWLYGTYHLVYSSFSHKSGRSRWDVGVLSSPLFSFVYRGCETELASSRIWYFGVLITWRVLGGLTWQIASLSRLDHSSPCPQIRRNTSVLLGYLRRRCPSPSGAVLKPPSHVKFIQPA